MKEKDFKVGDIVSNSVLGVGRVVGFDTIGKEFCLFVTYGPFPPHSWVRIQNARHATKEEVIKYILEQMLGEKSDSTTINRDT